MKKGIIQKFKRKYNLVIKNQIDVKNLFLDIFSHMLNFTKFQRKIRRGLFQIEKVTCLPLEDRNSSAHQKYKSRQYSGKQSVSERKTSKNPGNNDIKARNKPAQNSKNLYYSAWYKKNIIGVVVMHFICTKDNIDFWYINSLTVLKNYQGYGIGGKLTQSIIEGANGNNKLVYLKVQRNNFRAINLYKKLGFQKREYIKKIPLFNNNLPTDTKDSILMYKEFCKTKH